MDTEALVKLLYVGMLLIGALIVLWIVVVIIRHQALKHDEMKSGPGFDLDQLKRMREEGQISDDEYRILRENAIQQMDRKK
ncbi:MAG: hypothetical protein GXY33_04600 [Phycisphaerae bacterium]|nr:hypothetical protein [Phycisphaerae bacterium]